MLIFKSFISRNFLFVLFTFSLLGTSVGFSQDCKAELSVENNRKAKSAFEDGALFPLTLVNTSTTRQEFIITSVNLKEPCNKPSADSREGNVSLDIAIRGNNKTSLPTGNKITLDAGKTYSFNVLVTVPNGTPTERWSCIEVQVQSVKCNTIVDTEILKVFVPNPSEE